MTKIKPSRILLLKLQKQEVQMYTIIRNNNVAGHSRPTKYIYPYYEGIIVY